MKISNSQIEEVIASLYLIAGILAWEHSHTASYVCFFKFAVDSICALFCAIKELREEKKSDENIPSFGVGKETYEKIMKLIKEQTK